MLMDRLHHDGSLPHAGGDALDRAGAHVADRVDAGLRRRERRWQRLAALVPPGSDEAALVQLEAAVEPLGVRLGADHDEDVADAPRLALAGVAVSPGDRAQHVAALE